MVVEGYKYKINMGIIADLTLMTVSVAAGLILGISFMVDVVDVVVGRIKIKDNDDETTEESDGAESEREIEDE